MSGPESSSRKILLSVTSSLIAGTIIGVFSIFSPTFRGWILAIVAWIKGVLAGAWHFLWASHGVPGWLLVLGIVVAVYALRSWLRGRPRGPKEPSWLDYTSDNFEGVTWCWSYIGGQISGEPIPRCPHCGQVLVYRQETVLTGSYGREFGDVTIYRCENCGTDKARCDGTVYNVRDRVIRSIDRKLHSGEWRHAVARKQAS